MRYILFLLQIFLLTAKIDFKRFNTGLNISAIYQLTNGSIIIGTHEGKLMMFDANGSFISRMEGPHKRKINSIVSFPANQTQLIAVGDDKGLLSIWQTNGKINQLFQKRDRIVDIKVSKKDNKAILAVCANYYVDIHQIPTLKVIYWKQLMTGLVYKMLVEDFKVYLLVTAPFNYSIHVLDIEKETFEPLISRQLVQIHDFAVYQLGKYIHAFLISTNPNSLEVYSFNSSHGVVDYVNKSESNPNHTPYSWVVSLPNKGNLPLFVAKTSNYQLQFYKSFDLKLFLQLQPFQFMVSTQNGQLILAGMKGQVTRVTITEGVQDQGIAQSIVLLSLSLLAIGLYLCCGDCCPGVIQKWKRQRERQEIQLQLYRQRTQLQNF